MSGLDACLADVCGVANSDSVTCELIADALDSQAVRVRRASVELLQDALDALETCRKLACPHHRAARGARALLDERKCAHCGVYTAQDALVDVSELAPLAPLAGKVCEGCQSEILAESHEPWCECEGCTVARGKDRRAHRKAEAALSGGLSRASLQLLSFTEDELR